MIFCYHCCVKKDGTPCLSCKVLCIRITKIKLHQRDSCRDEVAVNFPPHLMPADSSISDIQLSIGKELIRRRAERKDALKVKMTLVCL